jgi:hypothetical protein
VTALTQTWTADEPLELRGRDLEGVLVRRERTRLSCAGVPFEFTLGVEERTESGLVVQYRLALRERAETAETAEPIAVELVVRPVIPAASLEKLGPWERTAVRQAARKLLLAAAEQVAARG